MENQILERLVNGFDDFRERLTRIEESVKPISDIKKDVDTLKVNFSNVQSSTKSAHHRLDAIDKEDYAKQLTDLRNAINPLIESEKEKKKDIKFLKNSVIGGSIGMFFTIIGGLILAVVKGWI